MRDVDVEVDRRALRRRTRLWPGLYAGVLLCERLRSSDCTHLTKRRLAYRLSITVKHHRIQVQSIWPCDSSMVYCHAREELRIIQRREHRSSLMWDELKRSDHAVIEVQLDRVRAHHFDTHDMWNTVKSSHGNGSIVPGTVLATACSHACISSPRCTLCHRLTSLRAVGGSEPA
jgi:hypothetical protein